MRRFWQEARLARVPAGFEVALDGKPVRLPGGDRLLVRSAQLAQAVADEWAQCAEDFRMEELPLTRLAGTLQERVAPDPEPVAIALARYAESDLLCYFAERPRELVERQRRAWLPWLEWAERRYGARLAVTTGVRHVAQDSAALAALASVVGVSSAETLTALGVLVPALGSLVLGLAVTEQAVSPAEAFALSALDQLFQAEQWGEDAEAAARRAGVAADVAVASRFVQLAQDRPTGSEGT